MPESPPELPKSNPNEPQSSDFEAAWFGGLIEGVRGSDNELAQAVADLNRLQLARVELTLEPRQFTALISERPLLAERWKSERLEDFVQGLQALVDASERPQAVESNMRCLELYSDRAIETLFIVKRGNVECQSLERRPRPSDHEYLARHSNPVELRNMGWGKKIALAIGALLLSALMGWQIGLGDLFFPQAATELTLDSGSFGSLLEFEVENILGGYQVQLQRGVGFPADGKSMQELTLGTESLAHNAAVMVVAGGGEIFLRVVDSEGITLAVAPVYLEDLLKKEDAQVSVTLPGFRHADGIELSIQRGIVGR